MELIVHTKSQTLDINCLSSHPPNVIEQISNTIQERLSNKLSNEEIFNAVKCEHEDALKKRGFKDDFKYTTSQQQKKKKIVPEIFFSLTHHLTKQYPQMLETFFFD